MTRTLVVVAAFLALSVSAALAAPPEDKPGKSAAAPGQSAEKTAQKALKKQCKELRKTNPSAFQAQCASLKAKKEKKAKDESESETEADEARENAAKKCKAERASMGVEAFKNEYGTNPNKANAFGKCVSKLAKEKSATD